MIIDHCPTHRRLTAVLMACLLGHGTSARATDPLPGLLDLSLEELMQVVVTSAAKKPQMLAETAAAIFVISAEDIRRSGARSIPEALRLAPGVQVAALGNNKWAISIRGQADRFSNKLLVLMDGRSVYSPIFSGVIWENHVVPLEAIERIEVLRGPGAALWGSNAVNGVINLITRPAQQGSTLTFTAGSELRSALFARSGWRLTPDTTLQTYLQAQNTGPAQTLTGAPGLDSWRHTTTGFRLDRAQDQTRFHLQGSLYNALAHDQLLLATPPVNQPVEKTQVTRGGHLLGRWEFQHTPQQQRSLQAYLEYSAYEHVPLHERRTTLDLEYQVQTEIAPHHSLTWGLGYRHSYDQFVGNPGVITAQAPDYHLDLLSAYFQDEIRLSPEQWRLLLGLRLEHNDLTGFNAQPNLRLLWTPNAQTSAWLSLAQARRRPALLEQEGQLTLANGATSTLQLTGQMDQDEQLDALDLGWRQQMTPRSHWDLSAFYYRYTRLRDATPTGMQLLPGGYGVIQAALRNSNQADAYGFEASLDWRPRPDWRIHAAYSTAHITTEHTQLLSASYTDTTPQHQLSLRVAHDWSSTLRWDAWLRYVDAVPRYEIPAYTSLDVRLAWQPHPAWEWVLVGQNLFDDAHPEFGSSFINSTTHAIERGIYAQLRWEFE